MIYNLIQKAKIFSKINLKEKLQKFHKIAKYKINFTNKILKFLTLTLIELLKNH